MVALSKKRGLVQSLSAWLSQYNPRKRSAHYVKYRLSLSDRWKRMAVVASIAVGIRLLLPVLRLLLRVLFTVAIDPAIGGAYYVPLMAYYEPVKVLVNIFLILVIMVDVSLCRYTPVASYKLRHDFFLWYESAHADRKRGRGESIGLQSHAVEHVELYYSWSEKLDKFIIRVYQLHVLADNQDMNLAHSFQALLFPNNEMILHDTANLGGYIEISFAEPGQREVVEF